MTTRTGKTKPLFEKLEEMLLEHAYQASDAVTFGEGSRLEGMICVRLGRNTWAMLDSYEHHVEDGKEFVCVELISGTMSGKPNAVECFAKFRVFDHKILLSSDFPMGEISLCSPTDVGKCRCAIDKFLKVMADHWFSVNS